MFREEFLADTGLVIKTVQRGLGSYLGQISITFVVLRKNQKMVVGIALGWRSFNPVVILFADIQLTANDRFDSYLLGRIHEMNRAKNIAVVGHGYSRHTQLFRAMNQLVYVASAVEHGIVRM